MSEFHRWLLKHRPYCELCSGPYPSTRIIDIQGHNKAVCDAHFQSHHPLRAGYERKVEIYYQSKTQEDEPKITRADIQTTGEKIPYFGHMKRKTK